MEEEIKRANRIMQEYRIEKKVHVSLEECLSLFWKKLNNQVNPDKNAFGPLSYNTVKDGKVYRNFYKVGSWSLDSESYRELTEDEYKIYNAIKTLEDWSKE